MDRMPAVPEIGGVPAGPSQANDYDSFTESYAAANETGSWNGCPGFHRASAQPGRLVPGSQQG